MTKEFSNLDPYEVLQVSSDADRNTVRIAFRKMALKWHPDKHGSSSKEEQEKAEIEFKKVAWAYEVLLSYTSKPRSSSSEPEPFDFEAYWKEWENAAGGSWDNFWDSDKEPAPIPEENLEQIREMWEREEALTEEERAERYLKRPIPLSEITPWSEYVNSDEMAHIESGIGNNRPSVDIELNSKVACWLGSLVYLDVDAIVNAANVYLAGGGGIDGAIHWGAGRDLYTECDLIGGSATGHVAITRGYCLPAKYIIHACGPIGKRPRHLSKCYSRALDEAVKHNIRTIAFPCISTGAYNYPLQSATNVALATVRSWLEEGDNRNKIDLIIFGMFQDKELRAYQKWMQWYFPDSDGSLEFSTPEIQHLVNMPMELLYLPEVDSADINNDEKSKNE